MAYLNAVGQFADGGGAAGAFVVSAGAEPVRDGETVPAHAADFEAGADAGDRDGLRVRANC
ncbi:hypothetical protein OG727_21325 [Streptomyces caniferus]|uniref:Uncharacterized protein n=1 Tax=Streptomyces caniferus TaxID=285557 RepID=A0ABZ1VRU5_9ACTN|nr:hypothetical protein [Streptomyces caniferus]